LYQESSRYYLERPEVAKRDRRGPKGIGRFKLRQNKLTTTTKPKRPLEIYTLESYTNGTKETIRTKANCNERRDLRNGNFGPIKEIYNTRFRNNNRRFQ